MTSSIAVSGRTGNGQASTPVAVNIVHTYSGDLVVDLIAPDGSVYNISNRAGGSADNINKTVNRQPVRRSPERHLEAARQGPGRGGRGLHQQLEHHVLIDPPLSTCGNSNPGLVPGFFIALFR